MQFDYDSILEHYVTRRRDPRLDTRSGGLEWQHVLWKGKKAQDERAHERAVEWLRARAGPVPDPQRAEAGQPPAAGSPAQAKTKKRSRKK
jgi:hypothetical protein